MSNQATQIATGSSRRLPLLDAARGVALLAMASYHFTWDLEFFGYIDPGTATNGLWKYYARAIATSFLFLVGFSLVLAHANGIRWRPFLKRLALVAVAAAAITVATLFALPDAAIYFGILHAIAAASLIGLAFLRLPVWITLLAALAALAAPHFLRSAMFDPFWLLWLGLAETPHRSNDYVPLLPWLAPVLIGIAAARLTLRHGILERLSQYRSMPGWLTLAGRHSLMFYLLHQPVLIALLFGISLVMPAGPTQRWLEDNTSACIAAGDDPGLCERFYRCAGDALGKAGMLRQIAPGWPNSDQQSTVETIRQTCTTQAEENR